MTGVALIFGIILIALILIFIYNDVNDKLLQKGIKIMWEAKANEVIEVYGGYVDWEERFYLCPECGEPIYECDWSDDELDEFLCPVCEYNGEE